MAVQITGLKFDLAVHIGGLNKDEAVLILPEQPKFLLPMLKLDRTAHLIS